MKGCRDKYLRGEWNTEEFFCHLYQPRRLFCSLAYLLFSQVQIQSSTLFLRKTWRQHLLYQNRVDFSWLWGALLCKGSACLCLWCTSLPAALPAYRKILILAWKSKTSQATSSKKRRGSGPLPTYPHPLVVLTWLLSHLSHLLHQQYPCAALPGFPKPSWGQVKPLTTAKEAVWEQMGFWGRAKLSHRFLTGTSFKL